MTQELPPDPLIIYARLAAVCAGLAVILFGCAVWLYQAVLWLRDGAWTTVELRTAWTWLYGVPAKPVFTWAGVQKIAEWILASPLSGGMIVAGALAIVFAAVPSVLRTLSALALIVCVIAIIVS